MDNNRLLDSGSNIQDILEEIKKSDAQISQSLYQREQKMSNNESVFMLDRQISQQVQKLSDQIKSGKDSLNESSKSKKMQVTSQIRSQQENQRIKNILDDFANRVEEFNRRLTQKQVFVVDNPKYKSDMENKTTLEMVQIQKKLYNQQEATLDNMLNVTTKIGGNAKMIGQQLDEDKIILRRLDENVDQTTTHIQITDSKLKGLLKNTSDCCLWTTIIVQFMIFIFLVIY